MQLSFFTKFSGSPEKTNTSAFFLAVLERVGDVPYQDAISYSLYYVKSRGAFLVSIFTFVRRRQKP